MRIASTYGQTALMLESLDIENFKRFKKLQIPELKRVNLIAGENNTGKTGILEAICFCLTPTR